MTHYVADVVVEVDGLVKPSRTITVIRSSVSAAVAPALHEALRLDGVPKYSGRVTGATVTIRSMKGG